MLFSIADCFQCVHALLPLIVDYFRCFHCRHAIHPDEPGQWRHGRGAAKAPIVHAELKRRLQQQPESTSFKKLVVLMEVQGAMLKEMLAMMKESRDHKRAKVSKLSTYDCLLLSIH